MADPELFKLGGGEALTKLKWALKYVMFSDFYRLNQFFSTKGTRGPKAPRPLGPPIRIYLQIYMLNYRLFDLLQTCCMF